MEHSTSADVIKQSNLLLYKFFNTANIAINQASNIYLLQYQQLLINNANLLKTKPKQIQFTKWKYKVQECSTFTNFANFVLMNIETARKYYIEQTGRQQPFLSVAHDGWDSKRKDILGVSIHFILPIHWIPISFPIGLKVLKSKTSINMMIQISKILAR
jgi:hypothetical protein